jgi:hypothetical protein
MVIRGTGGLKTGRAGRQGEQDEQDEQDEQGEQQRAHSSFPRKREAMRIHPR